MSSLKDNNLISHAQGVHTLVAKLQEPDDHMAEILGEKFRNYREAWKKAGTTGSDGKLVPLTDYPLHLNFEISFGCNYRCGMCLYAIPTDQWGYKIEEEKKISFEKYKEIVDEGAKRGLGSVSLNGYNEPLMQQDLAEYIRYARDKGVPDVFFVSNAIMLDAKKTERLLDSGLTRIMFSLDAFSPESYGKIRKEGGYEKVIANVLHFLKRKKERGDVLPVTRVSFVRNRINAGEEEGFLKFWSDKVDYILIQRFTNPFLGHERFEETEEAFRLEDSEPLGDCQQPFQRLYITNNGDVHPCCSGYGLRMTVGNIFEESVADIWKGKRMEAIRRTVNANPDKQPESCRLCRQASAMKCSK